MNNVALQVKTQSILNPTEEDALMTIAELNSSIEISD